VLTESYYWNLNDRTRELGERFYKRTGRMPNMIQAGTYSATLQYLKEVKAAGTKDADEVAKKLKELPSMTPSLRTGICRPMGAW
jgi:branched-chain amino acid transport system substrate-binding protein